MLADLVGDPSFALVRLAVAAIFALAGLSKLASFEDFARAVAHYPVASARPRAVATALVSTELAAAALLVPQATGAFGAALATVLLVLFTATVSWFGIPHEHDCGCLGALPAARTSTGVAVRNLALLFALAYVLVVPTIWPSAPWTVATLLLLLVAMTITLPAVQVETGNADPGRRAALRTIALAAAAVALLPVLRPKDALACWCGQVLSCGSCNHFIDSYYSGCCVDCTCSPPMAKVRRDWYKTCNVCCEGYQEYYCSTTYPCLYC